MYLSIADELLEPFMAPVKSNKAKMHNFTKEFCKAVQDNTLKPAEYSYEHKFSDKHERFGCYLYSRELHLKKGSSLVGRVHKYPTMNILLKGKIAVMTEAGMQVLEAPYTSMSPAGTQKIGYVLEDCTFVNVVITDTNKIEDLDKITESHTAMPLGAEVLEIKG